MAFEKEGRKLNGYSAPGTLITTDFVESVEVPESGEFSFEVPKDIQMVIINAINQEGLEPNSIIFNLSENRILSDGEETPPPNAPNIKEKNKKRKRIRNQKKKKKNHQVQKKKIRQLFLKKTIQTESTDSSIE